VMLWFATQPGMNESGAVPADFSSSLDKLEEQLDKILS
jgi:hypothetical protein